MEKHKLKRNKQWIWEFMLSSVPTDRRSFRTSPKRILEDLKIAKRSSKDLFFDPGTITIGFFKMAFLEF